MKDKNHVTISIDSVRAFEKIQHQFIIIINKKTLRKVGIKRAYLNIIKAKYDKPTANIMLSWENKWFPLRIEARQGGPLPPLLSNTVPATAIREEEETKGIHIGSKMSICADDKILHIEKPRDSTKKLLEPINEFRKVSG